MSIARLSLVGLALLGCRARTVGTTECGSAADCAYGTTCNSVGECVTESSEPDPFVLDDFEDGDNLPSDSRFAVWQHYSYNPPGRDVYSTPDPSAAIASNFGMRFEWNVINDPDGVPQYPGAGLRTEAATSAAYVDLSALSRVLFAHEYFPNETGCRNIPAFTVAFGCGELGTWFEATVPVSTQWTTATLEFAHFFQQTVGPQVDATVTECLALVDDFHFQVQVELPDGYCSAGTLYLDNISFR